MTETEKPEVEAAPAPPQQPDPIPDGWVEIAHLSVEQHKNLERQLVRQLGAGKVKLPALLPHWDHFIVRAEYAAAIAQMNPNEAPCPDTVTRVQMLTWLIQNNKLAPLRAALAADTSIDGQVNAMLFDEAPVFNRISALVVAIGKALQASAADLDAMFVAASKL